MQRRSELHCCEPWQKATRSATGPGRLSASVLRPSDVALRAELETVRSEQGDWAALVALLEGAEPPTVEQWLRAAEEIRKEHLGDPLGASAAYRKVAYDLSGACRCL